MLLPGSMYVYVCVFTGVHICLYAHLDMDLYLVGAPCKPVHHSLRIAGARNIPSPVTVCAYSPASHSAAGPKPPTNSKPQNRRPITLFVMAVGNTLGKSKADLAPEPGMGR